jgi:hypothetical protein
MHEMVHSNFDIRRLKSLRRPSFAGNGLPERMRSTAFAFLGLTAALGLALVATFAQLSFPVLSPAPAPSGPLGRSSVAEAVAVDRTPGLSVPAGGRPGSRAGAAGGRGDRGTPDDSDAGGRVTQPAPVASAVPTPASEPSTGAVHGDPATTPAPTPAPNQAPASAPPSSQSDPTVPPKPAPTPAGPAASDPPPAPAPGNSQSSAAAAHASERGVEASSKSSTAAVAPEAEPEAAPGNGNGKALGHSK